MFRGAQKKIIMLKSPSGRYFEQAYFIVKDEFSGDHTPKVRDLVKEANRILQESRLPEEKKCRGGFSRLFWFGAGMLSSALICALLLWIRL